MVRNTLWSIGHGKRVKWWPTSMSSHPQDHKHMPLSIRWRFLFLVVSSSSHHLSPSGFLQSPRQHPDLCSWQWSLQNVSLRWISAETLSELETGKLQLYMPLLDLRRSIVGRDWPRQAVRHSKRRNPSRDQTRFEKRAKVIDRVHGHSPLTFIFVVLPRSVTSHHSADERLGLVESSLDINAAADQLTKAEIKCIIPFSRGVLVAAGANKVYMFDRVDDNREYFRRNREILLPNDPADKTKNEHVVSMCLSPSEETLIALTDHQQIYQLSFSGVDITKVREKKIFERIRHRWCVSRMWPPFPIWPKAIITRKSLVLILVFENSWLPPVEWIDPFASGTMKQGKEIRCHWGSGSLTDLVLLRV